MAAIPGQPSFHILICLIEIWDLEDPTNPLAEPDPNKVRLITEVENIEIEESYRKLIGTASIKFPRGTIIKQTRTELNGKEYDSKINAIIDDTGVLLTTRTTSKKAEVADFKVGSRIRIRLGLTEHPQIAALTKVDKDGKSIHNDTDKLNKYKKALTTMFNGYITKCSIDTPIEIECENIASGLKKKACQPVKAKKNMTVNDFLADDGEYKLLKDTGLELHPKTKECDINIGKVNLSKDLTVADVLTEWGKYKLYSFIKEENGKAYVVVGRSYFSNAGKDSIINFESQKSDTAEILFSYHVANNGLKLMNIDKKFLAIEATGVDKQDKFYKITIRQNPNWDGKSSNDKWQVMNETKLSKKAMKLGATKLTDTKTRVDLSTYTVRPYMSRKMGISHDELLEEAIKFFESYNMNGIEGNLTLFGDLAIRTGSDVRLKDELHPQKNGRYFVDEVHTTFGTGGYRQRIQLPYCITRDKK